MRTFYSIQYDSIHFSGCRFACSNACSIFSIRVSTFLTFCNLSSELLPTMAEMRRRTAPSSSGTPQQPKDPPGQEVNSKDEVKDEGKKDRRISKAPQQQDPNPSFRIAKWAILRLLGAVYFVAFLGAYYQNLGLMGEHGLQPASDAMKRLQQSVNPTSPWQGFLEHPTLFWWFDVTDFRMQSFAIAGMIFSASVVAGLNSWLVMFALWLLDFSIVTIASHTSFYSYGWESQLLETGFLAIFLCELPHLIRESSGWRLRALWKDSTSAAATNKPSTLILWLFRWLCFRIALGAGLIKIRGSSCWARKTCLWYHFETQPLPSPLSFILHFLPKWVLTRAVDLDLFVQLYTSWFVLVPGHIPGVRDGGLLRFILRIGGFLQVGFMVNILLSGNFAFLNYLTIIPAVACLNDNCWPSIVRRLATRTRITPWEGTERRPLTMPPKATIDIALVLLIGWLSSPVITNLLQLGGSRQVMNGSFDNFRLVNTYGAFGDVGHARYEPILSVSTNGTDWIELELPCKPGKVTRRPCFCAPYHYRIDWNIWFIGFPPHSAYLQRREKWLYTLLEKILGKVGDERPWLDLLDTPSASLLQRSYSLGNGPQFAKVDMYHYQMAAPMWSLFFDIFGAREVAWWRRTFKESLIPPVQLDSSSHRLVAAATHV